MPDGVYLIPEKKQLPEDVKITPYSREQLQNTLISNLVKMGILESKTQKQPPERNGVPAVFAMKDGKVSSLAEAGLSLDSPEIVEAMVKGQIFAFPLGEKNPVQLQGVPQKGNALMTFRVSQPIAYRKDSTYEMKFSGKPEPEPPKKVREPRWYHKLFSFTSGNRKILNDYADYQRKMANYETAHQEWQKNLEAEAKQMNEAGGAIRQVSEAIQAKYGAGRTDRVLAEEIELKRAAAEAERRRDLEWKLLEANTHANAEKKGMEIVRNVYSSDPKPIDKYVNKERKGGTGLYTLKDFNTLTKTDIDLNKTQIGGKPVTAEQFTTLAMFAALDPDVGMKVQKDSVEDPKNIMDSLKAVNYSEQEAKEVITASVSKTYSLDLFTADDRMYKYFNGINMGKDLAADALKAYPQDKSKLAEIFSRAVESAGISAGSMNLPHDGGSTGSAGLNKLAREAIAMMDQDPELRQLAKEKYEAREQEFCKNHKLFQPRSFEDRIRDIEGFGKLCDLEQKGAEARQTLMQANLDGRKLSPQEQNSLVKDVLKANLAASLYDQELRERRSTNKPNGVNKGIMEFQKYYDTLTEQVEGDNEGPNFGTSGGGSSLAADMPTMVHSGLQNRAVEKPPTIERMLHPDQVRQLDDTAEQIMRNDGLDKASLDEVCRKVANWGYNQQYRGENLIGKVGEVNLNPQKQGLRPEDLEINPDRIQKVNKPLAGVGGP